jgi:uncharacterized membrane-anchored protein
VTLLALYEAFTVKFWKVVMNVVVVTCGVKVKVPDDEELVNVVPIII